MAEKHTTLAQLRNAMLRTKLETLSMLVGALEAIEDDLLADHDVSCSLSDSAGEPILDSSGEEIEGRFVYGDMGRSIYDPNGKQADIFAYADRAGVKAMEYANTLAEQAEIRAVERAGISAEKTVREAFDAHYDELLTDRAVSRRICDSAGRPILDSAGAEIQGQFFHGDMGSLVYDPNGKQTDIFAYVDRAGIRAMEYADILAEQARIMAITYANVLAEAVFQRAVAYTEGRLSELQNQEGPAEE